MAREQRWSNVGVLFFFLLTVALLSTESGTSVIENLPSNLDSTGVIFTLLGLGLAFFTSESVGALFNSVFMFFWNLRGGREPEFGGYSAEWEMLEHKFRDKIIEHYKTGTDLGSAGQEKLAWTEYSHDVFFSYFWQQGARSLVDWVSRRHTVFFRGMTTSVAIAFAISLSGFFTLQFEMGPTGGTWAIWGISLVLTGAILYNTIGANREARQMIDLWMRGIFDPQVGKAFRDIMKLISSQEPAPPQDWKEINLKPSFKVMRVNDIKVRRTENDQRLYYFDSDVDIVATTISKRHVESSHLHTMNTETYYVMRGKLLLRVEGQDIWLNEGDMIIVNPGACHSFETTDEPVTFLAIKKEPGLSDKKPC